MAILLLLASAVRPKHLPAAWIGWASAALLLTATTSANAQPSFLRNTGNPLVEHGRSIISAAWSDFDGDGRPDIFLANADSGSGLLFRNTAAGFVAAQDRLPEQDPISRLGQAWGDFDSDGDLDLVVTTAGILPNRLYANRGDGSFQISTAMPSVPPAVSMAPLWIDYDNDGHLDLVIAKGGGLAAQPTDLFRNLGNGSLSKVSIGSLTSTSRYAHGAGFADTDGDADPDLAITVASGINSFFRNDAGSLSNMVPGDFGLSTSPDGGTLPVWADIDNDGDFDLLVVTGQALNHVYRNDSSGRLAKISVPPITTTGGDCAGAAFADFDNDGWLDLIISRRSGTPLFFQGSGSGTFTRFTPSAISSIAGGNGIAIADFDLDGDQDVFLSNWPASSNPNLLENNSASGNWLRVQLHGHVSNRHGVGARITATIASQPSLGTQTRQIGGFDTAGTHELVAHFGLGSASTVTELTIHWPSGLRQSLYNLPANQRHTIQENASLVISPPAGTYTGSASVSILTPATQGVQIRYTTDGSSPSAGSPVYQGNLSISATTMLRAQAYIQNQPIGSEVSAIFTITPPPPPSIQFSQDTSFLSSVPSGTYISGAWGDYDNDTRPDLFLASTVPGESSVLRNTPSGLFRNTAAVFAGNSFARTGGAWGDVDNDGDLDLVMVSSSAQGDGLYINNGSGGFTSSPSFASQDTGLGMSAIWADYNSDGWLDLFVVNGGGATEDYNALFANNGSGGLSRIRGKNVTETLRRSHGAALADFDTDSDLDLLVTDSIVRNSFFLNVGGGEFVLNTSGEVGSDTSPNGGTTPIWADYDNDGDLDLLVLTGRSPNLLYRNEGSGRLVRVLDSPISNTGGDCAAAAFADFDNDGWLDLVITRRTGAPFVFRGISHGAFERIQEGSLPALSISGNGIAVADYDLDGDMDLLLNRWPASGKPLLFNNATSGNNWLKIRLVGTKSNRTGIGAKIRVRSRTFGQTIWQLRQLGGFDSVESQELSGHFGLGDATAAEVVRVEWPSGTVTELFTIAGNQELTITEAASQGSPFIVDQPRDTTVFGGDTASFTVVATGAAPLTYEWSLNGVRIEGASDKVLRILNASEAQTGLYAAIVSNPHGRVSSTSARLSINPTPLKPPTIVAGPTSTSAQQGSTVVFQVVASSPVPVAYAWYHNGVVIPGQTAAELTLANVQLSQAGSYWAEVSNIAGTSNSTTAVLSVLPPSTDLAPSFRSQIASQVYPLGATVAFVADVKGATPIQYTWLRNGLVVRISSDGSLIIPEFGPTDAGQYIVRVSNIYGTAESAPWSLIAAAGSPPTIQRHPSDRPVTLGSQVTLSVSASGTEPMRYTWQRNGAAIPGASGSTLILASVKPGDLGSYRVIVSNGYGSATSQSADVYLIAPTPPAITQHPVGGEYTSGATVVLTVGASGSEPLSYIWRRDGELLPGGPYGSQLVLADVRPEQSGFYTVRVLNSYGFADATPAVLRITNPPPPSITVQPDDREVDLGSDVTWQVAAEGAPPLRYQWFAQGEILANQVTPRLSLIAVQLVNEGDYWVRVSNAGGSVTSRVARLKIKSSTPLEGGTVLFVNRISGLVDAPIYLPDGLTRVAGPGFVAQLYGGPAPDALEPIGDPAPFRDGEAAGYWNAGGTAERGIASVAPGGTAWVEVRAWALAAGATYELAEASGGLRGTSGRFSLRTGGDGAPPTVPALLTALTSFSLREGLPPSIQTEPQDAEVDFGTPLSLSVTARGSALTYQWLRNASPLPGATTARFEIGNVDTSHAGDYQVIVRGSLGSVTSRVARVTVRVRHQFHLGPDLEVTSGARFSLPLVAVTEGGISSGTIGLRFTAQNLIAPAVTWSPTLSNATIRVLTPTEGETRLLFSLPGASIPAGTQVIAQVSFRARTTPTNLVTAVQFSAQNLTDTAGRPLPGTVPVRGAAVKIRALSFGADFNGNDRFDVGDATLLRRLAQGIDSAPSWEIPLRDLDGNLRVEEADASLMLRMLTGLDPAPDGAVAPVGATETPRFQLTLAQEAGARGRLLIATVRLQRPDAAVAGAEFTLEYPVQALRLASAASLRIGPLVPSGAMSVWNVEPGNQFSSQSGRVHFAVSSPTRWPGNEGVLAELTFEVLRGSARRPTWSMGLTASELTLDGYRVEPGGLATENFAGAAAEPPAVTTVAVTGNGEWSMVLRGDPRALYHIEGSSDLRTWTRLETVATDDTGDASFVDSGSRALAFRFYRVIDAGE